MPSPARLLFQLALSNLEHHSPAEVATANEDRGPLPLMAAGQDRIVDASLVHSACHRYRRSAAVTELKDYPDRSTTPWPGWASTSSPSHAAAAAASRR